MKDAQHDIKQTEKETIELYFSYLHFKLRDEALGNFYSEAIKSHADGFIIFPAPLSECNRFIVKKSRTHPVVLFNECHSELLLKHFPDVNELKHPNIASVSSDNMDEGRADFNLIRPRLNEMNHYIFIPLRGDLGKTPITSVLRMESFRWELLDVKPDARIDYINIDFASKITSSYLSQKLYDIQLRDPIDCIYITTGATHLACVAIEKLNERFGKKLRIFCIDHECSPSDCKYIDRGMQLGYVKQDVYQQGNDAVMMLYRHLMDGIALEDKLYRSICVKPNN